MTQLILIGDLLVCAFIIGLAAWLLTRGGREKSEAAAQIPLQDEMPSVPGDDVAPVRQAPDRPLPGETPGENLQ